MPLCGLSIFGDAKYRDAARELFAQGEVGAVEWTVDSWETGAPPPDTAAILKNFGDAGKLVGHGVHYPVLAAASTKLRDAWLAELAKDVSTHHYCGLSVHFGFSAGWQLVEGAPLPVPYCAEALEQGRAALRHLSRVAGCKVGLENLALSFSADDAKKQGAFIAELLAPVGGYLLLDLHNVYCQSQNFGVPMMEMVKTYPLHLVEEIHVSGGSWSEHGGMKVRRDTHDGRLPDEVLAAVAETMPLCEKVKFVFFEKLPVSFATAQDAEDFRADYRRLKAVVNG